MKVAILQSNYIPWKGVFDIIHKSDVFVFLEDVQFTKRDWRTRNYIKTIHGKTLLSVPVKKTKQSDLISNVKISYTSNWQKKHYEMIKQTYKKAPFLMIMRGF